jgi:hypothetical protein
MAIPWKIVRAGFLDGSCAPIRMFERVQVPGSPSEELIRLTTPEVLAEYRAIDPRLPAAMLELRDNALARDRQYARNVRILGCLQLAALAVAFCFLAVQGRL